VRWRKRKKRKKKLEELDGAEERYKRETELDERTREEE